MTRRYLPMSAGAVLASAILLACFHSLLAETRAEGPLVQYVAGAELRVLVESSDGVAEIPQTLVTITVIVEGKPPLNVIAPKKWLAVDSAETRLDNGKVRWQGTYYVEPPSLNATEWQPDPIKVQEEDADERTVAWKPWKVRVVKPDDEKGLKELRDKTVVESVPDVSTEDSAWLWGLGAGIATAVMIAFGVWWWRRRPGVFLTAAQWACREMDRLLALNLPARGESERFHTLLSNIVRRFIEREFHIRARRQTTPEFLQAMSADERFPENQRALLCDFMRRCDVGKFAGLAGSTADCAALTAAARSFVEEFRVGPAS